MPKSLHKTVAECAEQDEVSINQFLVSAIAEKVGAVTRKDAAPSVVAVNSFVINVGDTELSQVKVLTTGAKIGLIGFPERRVH